MLYDMGHRTQLYLDDAQHAWLRRRAEDRGSIAAVVRDLIDAARREQPDADDDPLIGYLLEEPPADGGTETSVTTLDDDLYGA
jgi:hypothetical protein